MPPLNIVHYLDSLDPALGGMVAHACDLAVLTTHDGHNVRILSPRADPHPETVGGNTRVTVEDAPLPKHRGVLMSKPQLAQLIKQIGAADVVHLHGCWDPASLQLAARLRKIGQRYVVTPHGMLDDWCLAHKGFKKSIFLRLWGKAYLAGAERVLYCAEGEQRQSERWAGGTPGVVIPAAMDLSAFTTLPGPELAAQEIPAAASDEPFVLFLSRIDPKKGLEVLLEAMALLHQRGRTVPLLIAGGGEPAYLESLRTLAKQRGVDHVVHFIGMVRGDTKVSLMQRAAMLALSTKQENFGLVLTEALAASTPVITTKGVDIWPSIERHQAGVICDRTPDAFSEAILSLLGDPTHAAACGLRGREWVLGEMNAAELSRRFVETYQAVVND